MTEPQHEGGFFSLGYGCVWQKRADPAVTAVTAVTEGTSGTSGTSGTGGTRVQGAFPERVSPEIYLSARSQWSTPPG